MRKNILENITIYSFGHLYIDLICAFTIAHIIFQKTTSWITIGTLIILYNVFAFGTQPLFGYYYDLKKKPKEAAILGIIITTIGLILINTPTVAVVVLGLGNALYHIGGGIVALHLNPYKATYPGIYVSTGAIGLFLGGVLGYLNISTIAAIAIGIIISTFLCLTIKKTITPKIKHYKEKNKQVLPIIIILLLISICMRALIGFSLIIPWKSVLSLGILLTIAIASGKFIGGKLGDKYGFMNTGIIGLLIATPLLTFFQNIPILVFIGAFCFNLVMPITLTALANSLPNYKGTAFGLTTLALVGGFLLYLGTKIFIIGIIPILIFLLINIGGLYLGLKKYEQVKP